MTAICLGDLRLYERDVDTLLPRGWLNDQVIAFFLELFTQRPGTASGVLHLEPSTTFTASTLNDTAVLREMLSVAPSPDATPLTEQLTRADLVIMPVNDNSDPSAVGGGHWSLLVFRRHGQEESGASCFEHYDSLHHSNLAHAKRLLATVAPLLHPVDARVPPLRIVKMSTPQQANGYDCGVYLLAIAELVLTPTLAEEEVAHDGPSRESTAAAVKSLTPEAVTAKRTEFLAHLQARLCEAQSALAQGL